MAEQPIAGIPVLFYDSESYKPVPLTSRHVLNWDVNKEEFSVLHDNQPLAVSHTGKIVHGHFSWKMPRPDDKPGAAAAVFAKRHNVELGYPCDIRSMRRWRLMPL